jgi:hypothetical protein
VQLLKNEDDKLHLQFESGDFESKRSAFEWMRTNLDFHRPFEEVCQQWADTVTISVNRRLQYLNKGKKSENTKIWAITIFKFLWGSSGVVQDMDAFQWYSLTEISKNLVRYHKVGRPRKNKKDGNYSETEEAPIPHYTTLLRILDDLVESELIERKKEIIYNQNNPSKQKENTFYRISKMVYDSAVTPQETIDKLNRELKQMYDIWDLVGSRLLAIIEILKERGIEPPSPEELSAWVDEHRHGKSQF